MKNSSHRFTPRQVEFHKTYLKMATAFSELSRAVKRKVGAIILTTDKTINPGFNGTPSGWENTCEDEIEGELVSKPEVIHAESNAIMKAAKSTGSCDWATLYVTYFPCFDCAKQIIQVGIKEIHVLDEILLNPYDKKHYERSKKSSQLLKKAGIKVYSWSCYEGECVFYSCL